MEESYILNDINGLNKRKLGRKEKKYIEKMEKEKEKEKNIKKIKEERKIKEKIKEKKKEKIKEEKKENKKRLDKNKTPKLFNKNLKSKRKGKKNNNIDYSEENSEENSKINIINTSKDGFDIINDNNMNKEYKQKSKKIGLKIMKENNKSDSFGNNIIKAYEKLSVFYKKENNNNKDILYNPELITYLKLSEKQLRNA